MRTQLRTKMRDKCVNPHSDLMDSLCSTTVVMDFILNDLRWLAGAATNLHSGMEHERYPEPVKVYLHPCCHAEVRSLPEIKALVLPDVLHYPNDLQRQHVLPQICGGTERQGGG